ncbi:MAG: extracellular solute-binding protein [Lachnospiraceae bacterium]|nr:extracellular solute-binding protein [Lachnospiraceae bacterium]
MKNKTKTIVIAVIVVAVLLVILWPRKKVYDFHEKYEGVDLTAEVEGAERKGTYDKYLAGHAGAATPSSDTEVDIFSYTAGGEGEVRVEENYNGSKALFTDTNSTVTWNVDVPESGFYNLYIEYLAAESRGVAVERSVYINDEIPFEDAKSVEFTRIWTNGGPVKVDNQGNEIRPTQVEIYDWQDTCFEDDMGYVAEPYRFYFEKGANTITLKAENEPMAIRKFVVQGIRELPSYDEYVSAQPSAGGQADFDKIVEGEASTRRSESSLYAKYDRSSPTTQPGSVTMTLLNYVGGDAWRSNGMWVEWEVEIPEDGFYNLMFKARQNYARGSMSNRKILIDGEVPFEELNEVGFAFLNDWECKELADENGTPFNIYLTKGVHTVRMEATLGHLGELLSDLESSTYRLNQIYRRILVYTGANPDQYRDYKIDTTYPEIIEAMDLESKRLFKLVDDLTAYSGQKADNIATAQTIAQQLERFVAKPQKITLEFIAFKDNITALGTAALNMSETKLDVDYLEITGTGVSPAIVKSNFFKAAWHEIRSFVASFFVDYNAVGDVYTGSDAKEAVTVWVLTGRDQGTILKSMIDDGFTPNTGVKVNVKIVGADALLNAVLAGRGPDVVLSVGADQPVNYALRGAAEDITQFPDYKEVLSHYSPSSYEQYGLDGHIYGVPEQQTFNVMFYRKDVLEELELEVPDTWKELIEMLPTIQGNNLTIGLPSAAGSSSSAGATTAVASNQPDLSLYFTLLYQYGGDMYNKEGTKTAVDTEAGIAAFDDTVRFFNDYGIPVYFDFVSRFRSGEMPIGIMPYSTYNTLMVSAPEIRGLWDFTLIPGTEKPDGTIDRSAFITGNATMMIATDDEQKKQNSWEFMKWWANADTQVRFGREIEALLGASARYNTANRDAFSRLSWSVEDIAVLGAQWDQTVGIREVPGGYFTGRHIANAVRKCINDKDDSRETIIDYSIKIDEEITKKRREFGMPIYGE